MVGIETEVAPENSKKDKNSPENMAKNAWTYPLIAMGMNLFAGVFPLIGLVSIFVVGFGCFYTIKTGLEAISKKQKRFILPFVAGLILNGVVVVANVLLIYMLVVR